MMARILTTGLLAASLAIGSLAPTPAAAQQRMDRDEAAKAIAAIIALGIGVAVARHGKNHDHGNDWDEGRYGEPFSPSPNVVCLPVPRQCFENANYSRRWTRRIFGS
jgi:hypothetical protein